MSTKFDSRQTITRDTLGMLTGAANSELDDTLVSIDSQIEKLYSDRNTVLADGGTVSYTTGTLSNSDTFKLHLNATNGSTPVVKTITGTSFTFDADGKMLYVILDNRTADSTLSGGNVVSNSATLPDPTFSSQEVVIIAKRINNRIYFRTGQSIGNGESTLLGAAAVNPSFSDAIFEIYDDATPTKKMKFQVAGLTGTQTYTPPAAGDTLAGLGTAQTFSAEQTFSAQIRVSDGSVTEPSIAFSNDDDATGTGLYRVSANSLGFAANGKQIGSYSSSGNWSFGRLASEAVSNTHTFTSDSLTVLSLQSTNVSGTVFQNFSPAGSMRFRFRVDTADDKFQIQENGTTSIAEATQAGAWTFGPSGANVSHHLQGTTSGNETVRIRNFNTTAGASPGLQVIAGTNSSDYVQRWVKSDASTVVGLVGGDGAWTFGSSGGSQLHVVNGRLTMTSNGGFSDVIVVNATGAAGAGRMKWSLNGTDKGEWGIDSTNAFRVNDSSSNQLGAVTTSGAWTLGATSGTTSTHAIRGTNATIYNALMIANSTTAASGTGVALQFAQSGTAVLSEIQSVHQGSSLTDLIFKTQNGSLVESGRISGAGVWTIGVGTPTHKLNTQTTTSVGVAGAASALPANPAGYILMTINGANYEIPYYNTP